MRSGIEPSHVRSLHLLLAGTISLDAPLGDETQELRYLDMVGGQETEEPVISKNMQRELKSVFTQVLDKLTDREKIVLTMHYGLNDAPQKSLREIGKVLDLSTERIRQIEEKAIAKLRSDQTGELLRSYLN